jgi:hypothetical protein
MNITEILLYLVPDAEFIVRGNSYEGLEWLDERAKPTLEEIEAVNIEEIELNRWRQTAKVDLYKLKIILDSMGDFEAVEGIILQQPKGVQLAWDNANSIRRNSPTVAGLAQAMEYSPEQLDTIFKQADEVEL